MKLKSQIMFAEIENEIVGLPIGEEKNSFNGLVKVNGTGRAIMDLLQEDLTEEELVSRMMEMYDVPEDKVRKDVEKVVARLKEKGLLEN